MSDQGFHIFEDEEKHENNCQKNEIFDEKDENLTTEYLTFRVAEDVFAVKLLDVREIIEKPSTKAVPKCQPYFKGLFNLRGEIAGLICLREKLNLSQKKVNCEYNPVILFDSENGPLGVIVDEMKKVILVENNQLTTKASVKTKVPQKYLIGFIQKDEEIFIVIDLRLILDEDELTNYKKIQEKK